jgi:hypothetical protein
MLRTQIPRWLAGAAIVAAALFTPLAVSAQQADLAAFAPAGASVTWALQPGAGATELTISGEGVDIRRAFDRGENVVVNLARSDGEALPDGIYMWELSESLGGVNDGVRDPENGRDGVAESAQRERVYGVGRVQSGSFSIQGGFIVDNTLEEASASR